MRDGHSISEVAMLWGFSSMTISWVHHEYWESGKISNLQHRCSQKKILQEWDQRQLKRIIYMTEVFSFHKLLRISMLGHQQVSACEPFNATLSICTFGVECPLVYPCWLYDTKLKEAHRRTTWSPTLLSTCRVEGDVVRLWGGWWLV